MNLGQSIRSGVKWLMLGRIGKRLLEFGFGIILARLLVPADFGMIVTIQVLTGFAGMLASGGMGQSLVRSKHADQYDFNVVFSMQLALGWLIYLIFFFAAPSIAALFGDPLYTDLIRVSTVVFIIRPFASIRTSWLNRNMEFKKRSLIGVVTTLLTSIASVVMAFLGLGVWSLALSGIVGSLVGNILLARITPLRLKMAFDTSVIRKHSSFGIKIVVSDFVSYLARQSQNLVISKLAGAGAVGLYNKGDSMSKIPNQVLVPATMEPLFRAMSKVQDDLDTTKYLFFRTITLFLVYLTPLYIGLYWVAEPFIGFVYGEKWLPAAGPLAILALGGVIRSISFPCSRVLAAQNRVGQEIVVKLIQLVIVVTASLMGYQWAGLEGVAWGIVLSQVLSLLLLYALISRILPVQLSDLIEASKPALILNGILVPFLLLADGISGNLEQELPGIYLLLIGSTAGAVYLASILLIPIPALQKEVERGRQKVSAAWTRATHTRKSRIHNMHS